MYIRNGLWCCTLSNSGEQTCIFETDCGVVHCPTVGNKRVYSKRTVVLYTVQQWGTNVYIRNGLWCLTLSNSRNKRVYSKRTVVLYTVQQWGTNVYIRNGLWCCTLSNSRNKRVYSKRTVVLYTVQQWGTNMYIRNGMWCCTLSNSGEQTCIFETDCGVVHCPTVGKKYVYSIPSQ